MRTMVMGLLLGTGLVISTMVVCSQWDSAYAQPRRPVERHVDRSEPTGRLIAFSATTPKGCQQITLIDPRSQVMSVYHIDAATGKIALKSVRRCQWDMQMDDFNGDSPSPREIRAMLKRQ